MAHSKRNTSLPHFTSHERSLLRNNWGTQRSLISRDSFLPFASCRLCLQPARSPVACAINGDLFCRECAISDLLAQRNEIKRLEKERGEARKRVGEEEERMKEEVREREVREFEMVSMGLEDKGNNKKRKTEDEREIEVGGKRKKTFELDEKELARVTREEEERLKGELKREKVLPVILVSVFVLMMNSPNRANPLYPRFGSPRSHPEPILMKSSPIKISN